jgi:hypothetical protein
MEPEYLSVEAAERDLQHTFTTSFKKPSTIKVVIYTIILLTLIFPVLL